MSLWWLCVLLIVPAGAAALAVFFLAAALMFPETLGPADMEGGPETLYQHLDK